MKSSASGSPSPTERLGTTAVKRRKNVLSDAELDRIGEAGWGPRTRALITWGPAGLLIVALLTLLGALAYGGGSAPLVVADPGPIVRWGLPAARLAYNMTAALTIGGLIVAVWCASRKEPEFERAMSLAQSGAAAWTVATIASALFTYLDVSAVPFSFDATFGEGMWFYLVSLEVGQLWLMAIVMTAMLSTFVFASRSRWGTFLTTGFALLTLWPIASLGHTAGAAFHSTAVGGITLHYTGAAIWLGGLVVSAIVALGAPGRRRLPLIERYSQFALIAFIMTGTSGIVATWMNVGDWERLFMSDYGRITLFKVLLFIVLGWFGVLQRRYFIGRMQKNVAERKPTLEPLTYLVAIEFLIMGAVSGAAAALGRTPSPQPQIAAEELAEPTPAQLLSGETLPPPFEFSRLFTEWRLDPIWTFLSLMGLAFYLIGFYRLRKRGDKWPWWRLIAFAFGILILLYNVNGAMIVYGKFQFSFHMTDHMILSMIIPIFIVLGAPMTLLLRGVKPRDDGSMGGREWVLHIVHSKYAAFFSHPIVAGINFAIALLVFYYTPLFRWATEDHVGHMWMIAHFLLVGYLFVESLIGDDPTRNRAPYPARLIALVLVMTFHAFFGLSIMTGTGLLVAEWYGATGRTWGPATALEDQQIGGAIAWGIGEFPTVILALIVGLQWAKSDEKRAKREDRRAQRDHDAELKAYNEQLQRMAERDAQQ
ncbi:cytochrome c oxidase assembly protein [Gulosibacter chungangensis]|uniref:Bifunctional copper resistance protein CopD/cytochrome c oxidase assembly protein n=1 Tax=Gulosibacter chungangensis TaxID=979746 RepID=A0A7J5BFR4_9MICO|nr:cytochrome c oxidase assembly protein [Gulosibacter chungangensis]KAB1645097.1 bifunctional copper resistance protein CopD/cytochrome c oxidase assembly protein [Gulosibacter chungangensis]